MCGCGPLCSTETHGNMEMTALWIGGMAARAALPIRHATIHRGLTSSMASKPCLRATSQRKSH